MTDFTNRFLAVSGRHADLGAARISTGGYRKALDATTHSLQRNNQQAQSRERLQKHRALAASASTPTLSGPLSASAAALSQALLAHPVDPELDLAMRPPLTVTRPLSPPRLIQRPPTPPLDLAGADLDYLSSLSPRTRTRLLAEQRAAMAAAIPDKLGYLRALPGGAVPSIPQIASAVADEKQQTLSARAKSARRRAKEGRAMSPVRGHSSSGGLPSTTALVAAATAAGPAGAAKDAEKAALVRKQFSLTREGALKLEKQFDALQARGRATHFSDHVDLKLAARKKLDSLSLAKASNVALLELAASNEEKKAAQQQPEKSRKGKDERSRDIVAPFRDEWEQLHEVPALSRKRKLDR